MRCQLPAFEAVFRSYCESIVAFTFTEAMRVSADALRGVALATEDRFAVSRLQAEVKLLVGRLGQHELVQWSFLLDDTPHAAFEVGEGGFETRLIKVFGRLPASARERC